MIFLEPQNLLKVWEPEVCDLLVAYARKLFGFDPGERQRLIPFLSIRSRSGPLCQLVPNLTQRTYERRRTLRNIILKARQTGMTTYIAARYFLETIAVPGTVTLQVAHSMESAQQIFRLVHRFFRYLPQGLQKRLQVARSTVRELAFASTDSRYIVDTAGNPNAGRGLTIHNLHASEVALWPGQPQATMAALLAAVPPAGNVDLESTAHGAGGYFHREWLRAKDGEGFTPHFFPWWMEPAYRIPLPAGERIEPTASEADLAALGKLTPEQIQYRRHMRAQFGSLASQEFAETDAECFLLAGRPVFEVAAIEARLRRIPAPRQTERSGELCFWLDPEPGRSYVIGADVAEGLARGDASAAVVFDAASGLQCAELCTRCGVHAFAESLNALGRRYHGALVAVERNNHGHAVLEALHHTFAYPRLFAAEPARPGWLTTAQSKPQAIGALDRMLREAPQVFMSRRLLEQCRGYSQQDSGGTGPLPGAHDDLVMAAAIALAVRESVRPAELFALPR